MTLPLPPTSPPKDDTALPQWGLRCDNVPRFGARLVQEGDRLHFLPDRADMHGTFSERQAREFDHAFTPFIEHLELMLLSGELNPRYRHSVRLFHSGFTCDADTLGSCGYVYIAIYPTPTPDPLPGG